MRACGVPCERYCGIGVAATVAVFPLNYLGRALLLRVALGRASASPERSGARDEIARRDFFLPETAQLLFDST